MSSILKKPSGDEPVRKSAQHLRWFMGAFERQVEETSAETGNEYLLDKQKLAAVFTSWKKSFDAHKPTGDGDKLAYVGFAAGLMLRALVTHQPARVTARPDHSDDAKPAYFWPEGYLYVNFCLSVRRLVIENDFDGEQLLDDRMSDLRVWWSFKENIAQEVSLAIPFLDLFAGEEPDWVSPGLFRSGRAREIASQRANEIIGTKE